MRSGVIGWFATRQMDRVALSALASLVSHTDRGSLSTRLRPKLFCLFWVTKSAGGLSRMPGIKKDRPRILSRVGRKSVDVRLVFDRCFFVPKANIVAAEIFCICVLSFQLYVEDTIFYSC